MRREQLVSGFPSKRALIPFMMVHPHVLITSQSCHIPNTITLGVRISTYEFWGDTSIQSITEIQNLGLEYQNSSICIYYIRDLLTSQALSFCMLRGLELAYIVI